MAECIHGLDDSWCATCKHGPENNEVTVKWVVEARYDGHCSECSLPIFVGQMIAGLSDDRVVHEECS